MLISVFVYTYNSEKTVKDTLESIAKQKYNEIELIICDDCSQDHTVDLAKGWVDNHKHRFVKTQIIINEKNLGITNNFKNSLNYSIGEWIFGIAGDDILLSSGLVDYFNFIKRNEDANLIISPEYFFDGKKITPMPPDILYYCYQVSQSKRQYAKLLCEDVKVSPSMIFSRKVIDELGTGENPIKNIDDWPFKLYLVKNGVRLYFMNKPTVIYRYHQDSISYKKDKFFNPNLIVETRKLKKLMIYPNIPKTKILYYINEFITNLRYDIIIRSGNEINLKNKIINNLIHLIEPYAYIKLYRSLAGRLYSKRNNIYKNKKEVIDTFLKNSTETELCK